MFPLFVICDHSQDIYKVMLSQEKPYMLLNGKEFCNIAWNPKYFRKAWLSLCQDISQRLNCPVAFCAAVLPDMLGKIEEEYAFSEAHYLGVVSDEKTIRDRLEKDNITNQDCIESSMKCVSWLAKNAAALYPQMTLIDITGITAEEAAEQVDAWILAHMGGES